VADAGMPKIADTKEAGLGDEAAVLKFRIFAEKSVKNDPETALGLVRAITRGDKVIHENPGPARIWADEASRSRQTTSTRPPPGSRTIG
jgi:hypothetical protein